ncbi:MAG: 30S ribosomal protein S20 [Candidatus Magasanikbacteria bacterium]|jgi:small subunit ribosomal protein S20|nr:30S ribosomal protein S20 [Candidatus Magasanikbacteria bacterium]
MPNLDNAKKAMRQAKKHAASNLVVKVAYKKAVKTIKKEIETNGSDLKEKLRLAQQKLDKAAKKGVIKKNTAARTLSRLSKRVVKKVKK